MLSGTGRINMSDLKEDNHIPVEKDKLKDEQKAELKAAIDAYEQ